MKTSNSLDKSNFSGVVGIKTRSELTEERISDEKVETEHRQLMGSTVIEKTHGAVSSGKHEV